MRSSTPVSQALPIAPMLVMPAPPTMMPPLIGRSPTPTAREVLLPQPVHVQYMDPVIADLQNRLVSVQLGLKVESQARETNGVNITVTLNELAALSHAATKHENVMQKMQDELMLSGRERRSMQAQIDELRTDLAEERSLRSRSDLKIEDLENDLESIKAHVSEFDWFTQNELQRKLHVIEERGNVQVNFESGDIHLVRPLSFAPRTTREKPTAAFTSPAVADAICTDLAEVMTLFGCPVTVEGHTKGGEGDFWQMLADERARVVVDRMVAAGADPANITPFGRPGTTGQNETVTKVRLHLPEEAKLLVQRGGISATNGGDGEGRQRTSVQLGNYAS